MKAPGNVVISNPIKCVPITNKTLNEDKTQDREQRKFLNYLLALATVFTLLNPFLGLFVLYNFSYRRAKKSIKNHNTKIKNTYKKLMYVFGAFGILSSAVFFWGMIITFVAVQRYIPVERSSGHHTEYPVKLKVNRQMQEYSSHISEYRFKHQLRNSLTTTVVNKPMVNLHLKDRPTTFLNFAETVNNKNRRNLRTLSSENFKSVDGNKILDPVPPSITTIFGTTFSYRENDERIHGVKSISAEDTSRKIEQKRISVIDSKPVL